MSETKKDFDEYSMKNFGDYAHDETSRIKSNFERWLEIKTGQPTDKIYENLQHEQINRYEEDLKKIAVFEGEFLRTRAREEIDDLIIASYLNSNKVFEYNVTISIECKPSNAARQHINELHKPLNEREGQHEK